MITRDRLGNFASKPTGAKKPATKKPLKDAVKAVIKKMAKKA